MAWIPRQRMRPFIGLFLFIVVWSLLPGKLLDSGRNLFYAFQAPIWHGTSYTGDVVDYWNLRRMSKNQLIESGRDLARLNAGYLLRLQEAESMRQEIVQLEQLLDISPEPGYRGEIARVMRRDIHSWWQQLTIRKGSNHDIQKGQAVVWRGGVVGRVTEVYSSSAVVTLVSSPAFRMAANFEGDSRPVTYQGAGLDGMSQPVGSVRDVVPGLQVPADQSRRLVSSKLGGAFPQGLTIGEVVSLETGPDGLFQIGKVILPQELTALREVTVLIPLE